jgi:hypothetical protein
VLHITQAELAAATGLSRDAVSKRDRLNLRQTQARLRDTVEILHRAAKSMGSVGHAFAWFRAQPLPSFGDRAAEDLVKEGRAHRRSKATCRVSPKADLREGEAQQGMPFKTQPLTLLASRVDCLRTLDLTDPEVLAATVSRGRPSAVRGNFPHIFWGASER